MPDEEAYEIVKTLDSDLARDLVSRPLKKLTYNQQVWLHILANETKKEPNETK